MREKGSQWGVLAHEGGVTPLFDVASMENENCRMGLQACTRHNNVSSQCNDNAKSAVKKQCNGNQQCQRVNFVKHKMKK